jgi:prevent-host-death family protein
LITVDEKTTIVGVAELRDEIVKVIKELKKHKVILTRRNKPVGVLIDYDEYEKISRIEEEFEDLVLGLIARERSQRKGRRTITLEDAEKKVGLR